MDLTSAKPTDAERKAQSARDKAAAKKARGILRRAEAQGKPKPRSAHERHEVRKEAGLPPRFTTPFKGQVPAMLAGSTTFALFGISINPGDANFDPRLSLLSAAFSMYRFKSLTLRWVPLGSAFADDNKKGEVAMNVLDTWYASLAYNIPMVLERGTAVRGKAWETVTLHAPSSILRKSRYIRSQNSCGSQLDMRLNDILCEIAVALTPSTSGIGFVEVSGVIEMFDNYIQNVVTPCRTNRIQAFTFDAGNPSSGVWFNPVFSNYITPSGGKLANSLVSGANVTGANTLTLGGGTYQIRGNYKFSGTSLSAIAVDLVPGGVYQSVGNGNCNLGGPGVNLGTYWTAGDEIVVSVPEDGTATITPAVNVTGTGTLTLLEGTLTVLVL